MQPPYCMYVALDSQQAQTLRELLTNALEELRTEIVHTDTRDYRDMLARREQIVEQLLSKLDVELHPVAH